MPAKILFFRLLYITDCTVSFYITNPQVCPGNYQQLLIVNAWIGDTFWAPLFYGLMPWRDQPMYNQVFGENKNDFYSFEFQMYLMINDALASSGLEWQDGLPVMFDFEL